MTQIRSILSNSLLLKELSGDEVEIILSLLSVRHVSRGEVITHPKDERPDDLFILDSVEKLFFHPSRKI